MNQLVILWSSRPLARLPHTPRADSPRNAMFSATQVRQTPRFARFSASRRRKTSHFARHSGTQVRQTPRFAMLSARRRRKTTRLARFAAAPGPLLRVVGLRLAPDAPAALLAGPAQTTPWVQSARRAPIRGETRCFLQRRFAKQRVSRGFLQAAVAKHRVSRCFLARTLAKRRVSRCFLRATLANTRDSRGLLLIPIGPLVCSAACGGLRERCGGLRERFCCSAGWDCAATCTG